MQEETKRQGLRSGAVRTVPVGKLAVIGPLAFLVAMAQGNLSLGLLFHARDSLYASRAETGLLAAVWFLSYMLACHLWRPISRRFRPRFCVLGATFVLATLAALLSVADSLAAVYALNALIGLATASFWPPLMGWLSANAEGERLNRRLGIFNLCWSGGGIISPALAGWSHEIFSALPLMISAGLFLTAGLLITGAVALLPGIGVDDDAHDLERRRTPAAPGSDGTPLRFPSWLGVFSTYVAGGVLIGVYPMIAREELGLRASDVGQLLLLRALATSVMLGVLGRTVWWHFRGWQMVVSSLLLGGSVVWLAAVHSMPAIGSALVAGGVFTAFGYVNSIFHGAVGSSRRVGRMALHESLLSAGFCCGSALGGMIYQHASANALLVGCAGFLVATALGQLAMLRSRA